MSEKLKVPNLIGFVVGIIVIGGAIYSVFFVEWNAQAALEPVLVRPLKTMMIKSAFSASARKYPGEVRANEEVDLAFQVSGQLIEFPVKKGQDVTQGELIGRLDSRNFENELATKQAALTRASSEYERLTKLAEDEMAAEKEVYDAKADYDAAEAEEKIAQKALDDTSLHAPFSGVVADKFVNNFENLMAKQSVISLQQINHLEIVVDVPEERVVRAQRGTEKDRYRFMATFEYLPGQEFDVESKEFSTEADPATQTYAATFVMPVPEGKLILPGMTATIIEYARESSTTTDSVAYAVPIEAVPVDGLGNYYVWSINEDSEGTGTVHRVDVQVGEMVGDDILVVEGVESGDRIALAGVHLLQEGQQVRPFLATGETAQ